MASTLPATISVPNETTHTSSRITREGRKITYKLRVIQRPERARACGQGAKSSSDRRPVDPPPIVDLQVLEGDELRDITFAYNANFFLFATLEEARQKVQGRVPVQNTNQPVLTGTPVAGMAYLDRPNPAGYFIFPDLSVRHEGQFRLSFTLFEETKEPKDADNDQPHSDAESSVHGRCEVKSTPFHVFSAKKFPGLTESTTLSRTVADQGCRVRIRRDVRMRRRTEKPSKDWDDHDEEIGQANSPSPQMHGRQLQALPQSDRQRSESTVNGNVPFQQPQQNPQRSNSSQDLQTQYARPFQQPADVSQSQQAVPSSTTDHQPLMTSSQVVVPQQHESIPSSAYPQSHVAPYHPSYQPQLMAQSTIHGYQSQQYPYAQAQAHVNQTSPQLMPYNFVQQPLYEPQVSHMRQPSLEYAVAGTNGEYQREQAQQGLQPVVGMSASDTIHPPQSSALPPLQRNDAIKSETLHESVVPPPSQYNAVLSRPAGSAKRTFGSTFSLQHINEPLRGGARPDVMTESAQDASGGSDEDHEWEVMRMSYRRADGSRVSRVWPQSNI